MKTTARFAVPMVLLAGGIVLCCADANAQLFRRRTGTVRYAPRAFQHSAPRTNTHPAPTPRPYYSSPGVDQAIHNQRMQAETQQRMQRLQSHNPASPHYHGSNFDRYNPTSPTYQGPGSFFSPMRDYNPTSPTYRAPSFTPSFSPPPTPSFSNPF